jgi:urease accessory protein
MWRKLVAITAIILTPGIAAAHPGVAHVHDAIYGFVHPLGGIDHILAMIAVGVFAAQLGGRALWLVPAAFVATMAAAGVLGMAGVKIPYIETGIALSVIVLGAAIALQAHMPVAAATALVGFFATFHGHAHGAEMPASASGALYGVGFVTATALLHAAGVGLGIALSGRVGHIGLRLTGGTMALAGIALLA